MTYKLSKISYFVPAGEYLHKLETLGFVFSKEPDATLSPPMYVTLKNTVDIEIESLDDIKKLMEFVDRPLILTENEITIKDAYE